jgi:serine/threonine-protein kinase
VDLTARLAAALADRYQIGRVLGSGGMATVYLAEDLRHHRQVAVKVLHQELAASVGSERFLREIEIAARLAHPNILPLFDSGEAAGLPYYVMPYVSGGTLRARLAQADPLPLADAVRILLQVVDGLVHAHAAGIVHRDITPSNVLLSGRHAYVADFGVARALSQATGAMPVTFAGLVIGTPAYMSPEQATADPFIDHRSDLYSVGAVAYEMLAGRPPFVGVTPHAVLAAHVKDTPAPLHDLRGDLPAALTDVVMRCLEKEPARRWARAEDLLQALEGIGPLIEPAARTGTAATTHRVPAQARRYRAWAIGIAGVAAVLIVAASMATRWRAPGAGGVIAAGRITRLTNAPGLEVDPALSPDGRLLAYAAGPPGHMRLFLLDVAGGRTIPLTDGAAQHERAPRWSPDGTRLVFHAGADETANASVEAAALFLVPSLGGVPRRLSGTTPLWGFSPTWSPDGRRIAFVEGGGVYGSIVSTIDADGSGASRRLGSATEIHSLRWSPDGRWIACVRGNPRFTFGTTSFGNNATSAICTIGADGSRVTAITPGTSLDVSPTWMPDGRTLLFVSNREGPRDVYRVTLAQTGEPAGDSVRITSGVNAQGIDLSRDGRTLAYSDYTTMSHIWAVALPATGEASLADARQITFGRELVEGLALSHDGAWLAYDSDRSGNGDIWKVSTAGGEPASITSDPAGDFVQDWSADDREVAFHSLRRGTRDIFLMHVDGTGVQMVVGTGAEEANPDLSPDGTALTYDVWNDGATRVWIVERSSRTSPWGTPRPFTSGTGNDSAWSPDGRQVAFVSSGTLRVKSRSADDERVLVQARPGVYPTPRYSCWMPDGRTVLYKADDERGRSSIWAVALDGGTPRRVIHFDDPARPSSRREFATDGTQLYFTIAAHESDIWLMELRTR